MKEEERITRKTGESIMGKTSTPAKLQRRTQSTQLLLSPSIKRKSLHTHCCNFVAVYLKAGLIYTLNHNMKLCGTTGVAPHMGEDTGAGGLGTGAGIKL